MNAYACIHILYVFIFVCGCECNIKHLYVCLLPCLCVFMDVCLFVCMDVCLYVCMYIYMCVCSQALQELWKMNNSSFSSPETISFTLKSKATFECEQDDDAAFRQCLQGVLSVISFRTQRLHFNKCSQTGTHFFHPCSFFFLSSLCLSLTHIHTHTQTHTHTHTHTHIHFFTSLFPRSLLPSLPHALKVVL